MRPNGHVADHGSLSGGRGLGTKGDPLDVCIAAAKDNAIIASVEARVQEADVAATLEVDAVIVGPPRITEHVNAVDVDVAAEEGEKEGEKEEERRRRGGGKEKGKTVCEY